MFLLPPLPYIFRLPSRLLRRRARRTRMLTLVTLLLTLLTITILLLLPLYTIYRPPSLLISYFEHRWPDILWRVSTSHKIVALTIDDAPSPYTDAIRRVLDANGARATFFVIGSQVRGREAVLRDLVAAGHELGNHALRDEPSRALVDEVLAKQIRDVEGLIDDAYTSAANDGDGDGEEVGRRRRASRPRWFRPGSGFFSGRMRSVVKSLGYRLVLGSVYPHDPQIPFWRVNARHVLSMLRPGAIIICHDRREWTLPMLREVLPEMRRRGYRVVTVTELLMEAGT